MIHLVSVLQNFCYTQEKCVNITKLTEDVMIILLFLPELGFTFEQQCIEKLKTIHIWNKQIIVAMPQKRWMLSQIDKNP